MHHPASLYNNIINDITNDIIYDIATDKNKRSEHYAFGYATKVERHNQTIP
jgi:hypothetical protein